VNKNVVYISNLRYRRHLSFIVYDITIGYMTFSFGKI